jgi:hypothetical protein
MSAATPCAHLCVAERGSVHLARRELMVLNAFVGGLRQAARSARSNREETAEAADSVRWQTQGILMAHDAGTALLHDPGDHPSPLGARPVAAI